MAIESRKREYDIAKGIGVILVIVGHMTGHIPLILKDWIFTFHMPLFFIVSGRFLKADGCFISFLRKRIKGLLIPYWIYGLLFWLFDKHLIYKTVKIKNLFDILLFKESMGVLWFLPVLFISLILTRLIMKRKHAGILAFLMVIVGFVLSRFRIQTLRIDSSLYCVGFIYAGYRCKSIFDGRIKKKYYLIIINIMATVLLLYFSPGDKMPLDLSYGVETDIALNYASAITTVYIVLELSRILCRRTRLISVCLSHIGENSIIYYPLMASIPNIIESLELMKGLFGKLISKVIGLICSFLISLGIRTVRKSEIFSK